MCCEKPAQHEHTSGCCCSPRVRSFLSKEERIEEIKNYISELKKEIAAAEEHLRSLQE